MDGVSDSSMRPGSLRLRLEAQEQESGPLSENSENYLIGLELLKHVRCSFTHDKWSLANVDRMKFNSTALIGLDDEPGWYACQVPWSIWHPDSRVLLDLNNPSDPYLRIEWARQRLVIEVIDHWI